MDRRQFLKYASIAGLISRRGPVRAGDLAPAGPAPAPLSTVYEARGGTPAQNVGDVLGLAGGMKRFVATQDIVLVKANGQWVRHGGTNTDVLRAVFNEILGVPGFSGEILLIENNQRNTPEESPSMWTASGSELDANGSVNFTQLIGDFHAAGHANVNAVKLRTPGTSGGRVTTGPADGVGYVRSTETWTAPAGSRSWGHRYGNGTTLLTWPIFDSPYSGTRIDYRYGAWRDGAYTGQRVTLINVPTLNHHGDYCGVTSALKHFMGVVELPGQISGTFPGDMSTFHTLGTPAMGGALGWFLGTVRMPDLTIVGAEWVGHVDRYWDPAHAKTITASTDVCALDQYGAKRILVPWGGPNRSLNEPDGPDGRLGPMLDLALAEMNRPARRYTRSESEFALVQLDSEARIDLRLSRSGSQPALFWTSAVPAGGFLVYRGVRPDFLTPLATVAGNERSFVDGSALADTHYYYQVLRTHGPAS